MVMSRVSSGKLQFILVNGGLECAKLVCKHRGVRILPALLEVLALCLVVQIVFKRLRKLQRPLTGWLNARDCFENLCLYFQFCCRFRLHPPLTFRTAIAACQCDTDFACDHRSPSLQDAIVAER
ncbi:hypothetical protein BDR06DRAFT_964497 [Suillus hirtellus]|nr:hypothetical protein BDR06DRAFT_964497 [Suillus hirtellus]